MNERIKQLALQAWMAERTEKDPKYKKSEVTVYLLKDMEDFHKKFAELIVKECAEVITETRWHLPPTQQQIAIGIKEHFGVNE